MGCGASSKYSLRINDPAEVLPAKEFRASQTYDQRVAAAFKFYDTSGDGLISRNEVREAMLKLGMGPTPERLECWKSALGGAGPAMWDALSRWEKEIDLAAKQAMNQTNDVMSRKEFVDKVIAEIKKTSHSSKIPAKEQALRAAKEFDENRDGFISRAEVRSALAREAKATTEDVRKAMMIWNDHIAKKMGEMHVDSFISNVLPNKCDAASRALVKAFQPYDRASNGQVQLADARKIYKIMSSAPTATVRDAVSSIGDDGERQWKVEVSEETKYAYFDMIAWEQSLEDLMKEADGDSDGTIDYCEFSKILTRHSKS